MEKKDGLKVSLPSIGRPIRIGWLLLCVHCILARTSADSSPTRRRTKPCIASPNFLGIIEGKAKWKERRGGEDGNDEEKRNLLKAAPPFCGKSASSVKKKQCDLQGAWETSWGSPALSAVYRSHACPLKKMTTFCIYESELIKNGEFPNREEVSLLENGSGSRRDRVSLGTNTLGKFLYFQTELQIFYIPSFRTIHPLFSRS